MSVDLVNSHVLIPHLPDWGQQVTHGRVWQSEVGRGLSGAEHRVAMRQRPRLTLSWGLVPHDADEQSMMHARLRAAVKAGYAAAPYWGRGIQVAGTSGAELTLASEAWAFLESGDYVLVRGLDVTDPEAWEVGELDSVAPLLLTMTASMATAWGSDAYVLPLLFGAFSCDQLSHRSDWHTPVRCNLRTLESKPKPYVDACALIDPYGRLDIAGDSFECYVDGYEGPFTAGANWDGDWVVTDGPLAIDDFESYTDGTESGINGGIGWVNGWVNTDWSAFVIDSFESYDDGDPASGGGTGWTGDWITTEHTP